MLISKEKFIYYVTKYKEAYAEQQRFQDALRPFFDFPVCTYLDSLRDAYSQLLVEVSECEDEDDIFSWWLYDSPNDSKIISIKDKDGKVTEYNVITPEALYDYLVARYSENEGVNA